MVPGNKEMMKNWKSGHRSQPERMTIAKARTISAKGIKINHENTLHCLGNKTARSQCLCNCIYKKYKSNNFPSFLPSFFPYFFLLVCLLIFFYFFFFPLFYLLCPKKILFVLPKSHPDCTLGL